MKHQEESMVSLKTKIQLFQCLPYRTRG